MGVAAQTNFALGKRKAVRSGGGSPRGGAAADAGQPAVPPRGNRSHYSGFARLSPEQPRSAKPRPPPLSLIEEVIEKLDQFLL